jgi:Anti-sigma factor NepR
MQSVFGAAWSGLNSRSGSSLMNTDILSRLGLGLRGLYQDLIEEPVPDFLALFIRELEEREQSARRRLRGLFGCDGRVQNSDLVRPKQDI